MPKTYFENLDFTILPKAKKRKSRGLRLYLRWTLSLWKFESRIRSHASFVLPFVFFFVLFCLSLNLGIAPAFGLFGFFENENGHKVFLRLLKIRTNQIARTVPANLIGQRLKTLFIAKLKPLLSLR